MHPAKIGTEWNLAKGEGISFNELVLRCCEYALKDYGGDVELTGQGEISND